MGVISRNPDPSIYILLALTTLPLVVRRRLPWEVFIFTFLVFVTSQGDAPSYSFSAIGPMIALLTLASERTLYETGVAAAIVVILLFWMPPPGENAAIRLAVVVQNLTLFAVAAGVGLALYAFNNYKEESKARAEETQRRIEEESARRVEEERVRIAREIHDITAHSLSAVSIQAAAAERLIDRNPAMAKEAVAQIRLTSKSALEEIRSMISVLRNEDAEAETKPTNGTDRMSDLCEYAREAGLEVTYDDAGYDAAQVPAYVDVALFGIAREAITNTVRHAHAHKLKVRLANTDDTAVLSVEDDGCGMPEGAAASDGLSESSGHGVQGMAERVTVLKGTFSAGNRPQGGFAVRVELPLGKRE
jgi:signal transduction histidine kinase